MSITFSFAGAGDLAVNVSEGNARPLLERLGLLSENPSEVWGETAPEDFLGRALTANVGRDDSGVPSVTDGRWTDGGNREGYFEDRMTALATLARAAVDAGAQEVYWG